MSRDADSAGNVSTWDILSVFSFIKTDWAQIFIVERRFLGFLRLLSAHPSNRLSIIAIN